MSETNTHLEVYLKTFFEIELNFLADFSLQKKTWAAAQNDGPFGTSIMLILESWSVIEDNRKKLPLSESQFTRIKKLIENLKAFIATSKYPSQPSEYRSLFENLEWKQIQRSAKEIYDSIYPTLG